ncbi:hypothetical protein NN561_012283 [Cricetulus griseus]
MGIRRTPQPERDFPRSAAPRGTWRGASPRGPTVQARKGGAAGTHRRGSPGPRSTATSELCKDQAQRGPQGRGAASADARGPAGCSELQPPGRRRRRATARIVQPAARAPEPGPGLSPAGAEGTVTLPPTPPPPPLQPRRPCRWRSAPSPLVPSVKSSVLCLAAAIVWRGPVPCLGRRPLETEGSRSVSGCGLAGSALRLGRPEVGGRRGRGERPGAQGRGRPAS